MNEFSAAYFNITFFCRFSIIWHHFRLNSIFVLIRIYSFVSFYLTEPHDQDQFILAQIWPVFFRPKYIFSIGHSTNLKRLNTEENVFSSRYDFSWQSKTYCHLNGNWDFVAFANCSNRTHVLCEFRVWIYLMPMWMLFVSMIRITFEWIQIKC